MRCAVAVAPVRAAPDEAAEQVTQALLGEPLQVERHVGSWALITDPRRHVKVQAGMGVSAASLVTGWCGDLIYGPIGLVAPLGLLAAVHLVNLVWNRPETEQTADTVPEPVYSDPVPTDAETVPDDGVDRVSDLRAHAAELGRMPGRDAIKARYGVGSATANRLRAAAEKPDLRVARG